MNKTKKEAMFVTVAFVEEFVYRGWGLNALSVFFSEKTANIISSIFHSIFPARDISGTSCNCTMCLSACIKSTVRIFVLQREVIMELHVGTLSL